MSCSCLLARLMLIVLPQSETARRFTSAGVSFCRSVAIDPAADPWRVTLDDYATLQREHALPDKPCRTCKGIVGLAKAVIGIDATPRHQRQARQSTCKGCPDRRGAVCGLCGCVLAAKVRLKGETCPVGKW